MPTDYILFVHGVKTRKQADFRALADSLFNRIKSSVGDQSRVLKPIVFFWGDLNQEAQDELLNGFKASPKWSDFWFQDFRTQQVLGFVGDAALYLSRHVGSQVVQRFEQDVLGVLQNTAPGDRLHLVTHSWGTVILFDLLFAARWEDTRLDPKIRQTVQQIRNTLFGLPPVEGTGIPITSIHTMGSPISLFSLLTISGTLGGASTHDLSPDLKNLLEQLYNLKKKPIPWRNFAHPGDPIAYPLEGVIPLLLNESSRYVQTQDVITDKGNFLNRPFQQRLIPVLWGGEAHGSYWSNEVVSQTIAEVIRAT
ncbi:hypothetical protein C7B65_15825 [Phormidesmis priestleyi ULC007]|uniref:Alpha/beta hydrolase n=1 Tax=Phormidesmis priestleyi ULC007 TaxID=1920490 RepID=A0A2T1DD49_9CYAN|nr:hypothetical protein [Phormidesmis priestleyi]PSB18361.1 hypothetical protein C7B65_15825 [Phormidesmis priestleyi ULC007]PZO46236.1 MAG: hypothetical protein DCF14_23310 [Phormidesmis priestleyi]